MNKETGLIKIDHILNELEGLDMIDCLGILEVCKAEVNKQALEEYNKLNKAIEVLNEPE